MAPVHARGLADLLEVTVFRCLALQFNFDYRTTLLLVLWALGWAMIVLSVLIYLPRAAIAAFGIVLILGHNALDPGPLRHSPVEPSCIHPTSFSIQPSTRSSWGTR